MAIEGAYCPPFVQCFVQTVRSLILIYFCTTLSDTQNFIVKPAIMISHPLDNVT